MAQRYEIKQVPASSIGYGINGTGRRVKELLWIVVDSQTGQQKFAPPQSEAFAQRLCDMHTQRAA